jgi:hypothetical protein
LRELHKLGQFNDATAESEQELTLFNDHTSKGLPLFNFAEFFDVSRRSDTAENDEWLADNENR